MTLAPPNPDKAALRRQLRQARLGVSEAQRRQSGRAVERLALRHRLLSRKRRLGLYMPAKGEIDCLPLLSRALHLGAECYLPIVPHPSQRKLWFTALGEGPHWRENRFGIPEYGHHLRKFRASRLDILFMPLLGFDLRGYRMGMGGGFYDASLKFLRNRPHWHRPRLIGLAFEVQKLERLPEDPWDIPLDAVLTEKRLYRFGRRGRQ